MNEENLVITEFFSKTVRNFPQQVCFQIKKGSVWEKWTYKQLEDLSLKLAGFLIREKGLKKGDFACLILENCPEWATVYFGIMKAGLSCLPLDPQLSPDEIRNIILDCSAKIVFTSNDLFSKKIKQAIVGTKTEAIVLDAEEVKEKIKNVSYEHINWPEVKPEDIASLIYTSGTTGKPKAVMLTHKNICSNFISIKKLNLCYPSDNFLSVLPLYHAYAFMVTLIVPLFLGAKVTYALNIKSQEIFQIISEASITILVGVPQIFSLLHKAIMEKIQNIPFVLRPLILPFVRIRLRSKFGSLRLLVSGGARLEPDIGKGLTTLGLKIIEGYGLTETSPVVTINPPNRIKFGSVGKPLPDVEIKIANPDKKAIGQVLIKGPNVMAGYFKQEKLTADTIREGWFYSGDLGYIDKEGYLFLVGREKEVIVLSSGKNIYPEELEEYYQTSPWIKEIAIIPKTEKTFGYPSVLLFAVIVPDLEYFKQKRELNIREKIRWDLEALSKKLPSYQHIMGFVLTKEKLPRTALGKIKRYQLIEKYLSKNLPVKEEKASYTEEELAILNKEIAKKIIRYISEEIKKPVDLNSHLEIDLGIDSLTRVELGLGLEALLKIKIPDELLYKVATVKDLIINLEQLIQNKNPRHTKTKEKNWKEILAELPPEEVIKKIKIDFGFYETVITFVIKNIFLLLFRILWLLRSQGSQNLPKQGPYLICPNHASYLDGLFIFLSLPFKISINTYFVGYQRIFEHPLLSWAIKICRLISIDTETHLTLGMQAVSFVLSHKKTVCIFPEGRRSIDKQVKEFKKGVGILIKELGIPVVPVYIQGSHYSWPRSAKLPRPHPIKVIFGHPIYPQQLNGDYETIAKKLRDEVLKLIPGNASL
ncbi:MAG: AMP-binding protein [Candidatus Omnitrophica bacterium]|nr:AMP-binding protein [Candidatus Omnitrophota bacterium]